MGEEIFSLLITQLAVYLVIIFSLFAILWYTTKKYLIEKRNALIDSLTQIYNRKAVFSILKQELNKTERFENHPTSVAMIDIDFFKKYNDTNGHVAGDRLLKKFAKILQKQIRVYDIVGRYGGEEFIIIFPETKLKNAYAVCERIRKKIENTQFYGQQNMPNKKVTISVGIAEAHPKKKIKKTDLINKADKFLYKAKKSGRNKVLYHK